MIPSITWAAWAQFPYVLCACCMTGLLLMYALYRSHRVRQILASRGHAHIFLIGYSRARLIFKSVLFFLGMVILSVALLRPQWGQIDEVVEQNGRDLLIALDISRSMCAQDCMPNRLTCAKEKIKKLVSLLSCERVGLLLFSGSCFVQCPLTHDYDAFMLFLDLVDLETISSGTTAIDQVINQALDSYTAIPDRKNKLLVIFTDGEDFSSNLADAKAAAAQVGMHIFTVGVGTQEGAPIPLFDEHGRQVGHQKDRHGTVVISRVNDGILSTLARDVGGVYVPVAKDMSDMKMIADTVSSFETEKLDDKSLHALHDRFYYFLAAAAVCFALEWII